MVPWCLQFTRSYQIKLPLENVKYFTLLLKISLFDVLYWKRKKVDALNDSLMIIILLIKYLHNFSLSFGAFFVRSHKLSKVKVFVSQISKNINQTSSKSL